MQRSLFFDPQIRKAYGHGTYTTGKSPSRWVERYMFVVSALRAWPHIAASTLAALQGRCRVSWKGDPSFPDNLGRGRGYRSERYTKRRVLKRATFSYRCRIRRAPLCSRILIFSFSVNSDLTTRNVPSFLLYKTGARFHQRSPFSYPAFRWPHVYGIGM